MREIHHGVTPNGKVEAKILPVFFKFSHRTFCSMFTNNGQMHGFCYQFIVFILPLVHVSTHTCHHHGALPCLLSYMRIECNN
jgi:hypothetical protein